MCTKSFVPWIPQVEVTSHLSAALLWPIPVQGTIQLPLFLITGRRMSPLTRSNWDMHADLLNPQNPTSWKACNEEWISQTNHIHNHWNRQQANHNVDGPPRMRTSYSLVKCLPELWQGRTLTDNMTLTPCNKWSNPHNQGRVGGKQTLAFPWPGRCFCNSCLSLNRTR